MTYIGVTCDIYLLQTVAIIYLPEINNKGTSEYRQVWMNISQIQIFLLNSQVSVSNTLDFTSNICLQIEYINYHFFSTLLRKYQDS